MARSATRPRKYKSRVRLTSAQIDAAMALHTERGLSLSAISRRIGCSITPLQRAARVRGIIFPTKNRWSNVLRERVASLYAAGDNSTVLAERFSTTASVILQVVRDEGETVRHSPIALTSIDEQTICDRYLRGEAACEIAPEFGVFHKRVLNVLRTKGVRIRKNTWVWWTDRRDRRFHFRSKWELWTAQLLDSLQLEWEYEHQTFDVDVDGDGERRRYTPDFWVFRAGKLVSVIDVKGKTRPAQMLKIGLFQEQYPDVPFEVWDGGVLRSFGLGVQPSLTAPYAVS